MYLWKLAITGVETEEILVPFAFIKKGENYKNIDFAVSEELLSVETVDNNLNFDSSPIKKDEFISVWDNWKKPVQEKYQKRNERLFDRETDRINRYYDVFTLRVEDKLRKLETEKAEVNRKRDNSADLEERRKLQKRLQDIAVLTDRLQIEQLKLKQEASELRKKELDELWKKLEPVINEELVAITHFKII